MRKSPVEQIAQWELGSTSVRFETGGRGVGTVSTGIGDNGGVSFGAYQLSSSKGTVQRYLRDSRYGGYGRHFEGLTIGTPEHTAKWKELARTDPAFATTQHDFIRDTHYQILLNRLKSDGFDLSRRGVAIQDLVWSTSVQFGGDTSVVTHALRSRFGSAARLGSLSDADIINAVQDYKASNNESLFRRSSEAVRAGTLKRAGAERDKLLELLDLETVARGSSPVRDAPVEVVTATVNTTGISMCSYAVPGVDIGYSWCVIEAQTAATPGAGQVAPAAESSFVLRNDRTGQILANVCTDRDVLTADAMIYGLHSTGRLPNSVMDFWSDWSTSRLLASTSALGQFTGLGRTTPIGAFYESRSLPSDTAASIAIRMFRIMNASGQAATLAELSVRDTNRDGILAFSELSGFRAWSDINEDGIFQSANESQLLSGRLTGIGLASLRLSDVQTYLGGNGRFAGVEQASGVALPLIAARFNAVNVADGIRYASLRASNPRFYINADQWIDWSPDQIRITSDQTAMLGTDGDDQFDIRYYARYDGQYFTLSRIRQFYAGAGNDSMGGSDINDSLWGGAGHDTLLSGAGNDLLVGEEGNDELSAFTGDDTLLGGEGNDLLVAWSGRDLLSGGTGSDELQGGDDDDLLDGGDGADRLFGQVGNDTLSGGSGDDILKGFTGDNEAQQSLLAGQSDDDLLYGGDGSDLLLGGLGRDSLWGGTGTDEMQGGDGDDSLYGEADADRLFGQVGNDTLYGGDGDDILVGFRGSNESRQLLIAGESDRDWLYGGSGCDTLLGGLEDDYLDGGAGADSMEGGAGNDIYIVNSVNDVVLEQPGEGIDTVYSSANYILNSQVEVLRLVEGLVIHGTGNSLDNTIIGNAKGNILDGVTGADTLIGGGGDDIYYVDNAGDSLIELSAQGTDTVYSSISWRLGNYLENINLLDFSKPEKGLADGVNILVYGYPKAFELDYTQGNAVPGFRGTCALTSIANLATQAHQSLSELQVVGRAIEQGWCIVDPVRSEFQRGGSDARQQQMLLDSYGLRNRLIEGYNEQAIANLLQGGRGVIMGVNAGRLWDDSAYLDTGAVNHVVTVTGVARRESGGEITGFYIADSGRGKVSDMTRYVPIDEFRASANVGNAYAIHTVNPLKLWNEDISATGNLLDNVITGNRGQNRLVGGRGNDTLTGMAGNDTYVFSRGDGRDTVVDNDATNGNTDCLQFTNVRQTELWFSRSANDLTIKTLGLSDQITIRDWYVPGVSGCDNQIERIVTSDGYTMYHSDVDQLVQAMAAFPPPGGLQSAWRPGDTSQGKVLMTVNH